MFISLLCTFLPVYLALDVGSTAQARSRSAPASGHDVHRPDLDWNLTIARPCLP